MGNSLFERVGGGSAVHRIVERFYALVEVDEVLRPVYPEDLEPGKLKLALFLGQWLGGPPAYTERFGHPRLRRRHFPFVINQEAAGRWLRHMRVAMSEAGMAQADLEAVFRHLGPLARHMVNAHEDVPRDRLGDIRLT